MPTLGESDLSDVAFAAKNGFSHIAVSFTRRKKDIEQLREYLKKILAKGVKIVAKIENHEGIDHLEDIIDASDMIMVARGDL